MKIMLCISIVIAFTYIGKELTNNYYIRLNYFKDMKNFLEYCKLNISFNTPSIIHLIEGYEFQSKFLKQDMINYKNSLINNYEIKLCNFLIGNEKIIIQSFINDFGKKDKTETLNLFCKYIDECSIYLNKLNEIEKQKGILPLKLSLSLGVLICILLI